MPHTHTSPNGDHTPHTGSSDQPGTERPVSHFDKKRTHTHSSHGYTPRTSEHTKPQHSKHASGHTPHATENKPRHSGT